jgi:hypothetical protein
MGERSLRRLPTLGANSVVIKRQTTPMAQPRTWLGDLLAHKPGMLLRVAAVRPRKPGARHVRKRGGPKRRVWRKIHLGIDEETLELRAAEFTTSDIGDAPMPPELPDQIPREQEIASVTADGAFDTRGATAFGHSLEPVAFVPSLPTRRNAKLWKPDTAGAIARDEILRTSKRLGRTIRRRWSAYHRRSRSESKMHRVKLPGQRLSARQFDRQVAEFQVHVAVLTGFTAPGIPSRKPWDESVEDRGPLAIRRFWQQSRPIRLGSERLTRKVGQWPVNRSSP